MTGSLSSFNLMARKRNARRPRSSDILNHVLKYLPLRDAVRTSILSKEWRYKWLTIPYLVFDDNFENSLAGKYKPESIINRVLARHKGPIVKFTLIPFDIRDDESIIERWVDLISNHPIEDLTLDMPHVVEDIDVVSKHLFNFDCLKHLRISHTRVELPHKFTGVKLSHTFKGFPHLLTLYLHDLYLDPVDLHMIVSKCPVLEILHVLDCLGEIDLVIDAPNLKAFHFEGNFKSFVFKNVGIEEISLCNKERYSDNDDDESGIGGDDGGRDDDFALPVYGSNFINIFGQLSSLRKVAFDLHCLKFLAKGGVPYKLPNYLKHMTTLEFSDVNFRIMDDVACLLCLIRSSPNLQNLEISCLDGTDTSTETLVIEHLKAQPRCEVPFGHNIKNIRMDHFRGLKTEMAFVKVILLKSMLLMKLIIKFPSRRSPKNVCEVVKALAGFRRASSEAVIEFG